MRPKSLENRGARDLSRRQQAMPSLPAAAFRISLLCLAAALTPDSVSLLDPNTGTVLLTLTHPVTRTIRALDLSPDGTRLCALAGTLAQVWKLDAVDEVLAAGPSPGPPAQRPAN